MCVCVCVCVCVCRCVGGWVWVWVCGCMLCLCMIVCLGSQVAASPELGMFHTICMHSSTWERTERCSGCRLTEYNGRVQVQAYQPRSLIKSLFIPRWEGCLCPLRLQNLPFRVVILCIGLLNSKRCSSSAFQAQLICARDSE